MEGIPDKPNYADIIRIARDDPRILKVVLEMTPNWARVRIINTCVDILKGVDPNLRGDPASDFSAKKRTHGSENNPWIRSAGTKPPNS